MQSRERGIHGTIVPHRERSPECIGRCACRESGTTAGDRLKEVFEGDESRASEAHGFNALITLVRPVVPEMDGGMPKTRDGGRKQPTTLSRSRLATCGSSVGQYLYDEEGPAAARTRHVVAGAARQSRPSRRLPARGRVRARGGRVVLGSFTEAGVICDAATAVETLEACSLSWNRSPLRLRALRWPATPS